MFQGTGSKPPGEKGRQRARRLAASLDPFKIPCLSSARNAYSEQDGWNLQVPGPRAGLKVLYAERSVSSASDLRFFVPVLFTVIVKARLLPECIQRLPGLSHVFHGAARLRIDDEARAFL